MIKNYNEESDEVYFLEVNVQYPGKLHELYNDLPFLHDTMKIEKFEKLVADLHDKNEFVIHVRNLKLSWINFEKKLVGSLNLIKMFGWNSILILTQIWEKKAKNDFEKYFFKLMSNAVFRTFIKLVTTERRWNYLVSEPNYHTTKFFTGHLLTIEMKKKQIVMSKPVYLRLSLLELSKILMYEFWYDYVKPKCGKKAKLCYMDTNSFLVYTKPDDIYKNIVVWYFKLQIR